MTNKLSRVLFNFDHALNIAMRFHEASKDYQAVDKRAQPVLQELKRVEIQVQSKPTDDRIARLSEVCFHLYFIGFIRVQVRQASQTNLREAQELASLMNYTARNLEKEISNFHEVGSSSSCSNS